MLFEWSRNIGPDAGCELSFYIMALRLEHHYFVIEILVVCRNDLSGCVEYVIWQIGVGLWLDY